MARTLAERLAKTQERLAAYEAAELAILEGAQSYNLGTRSLTRADLGKIKEMIENLERKEQSLDSQILRGGRMRTMRIVPRD